MLRTNTVFCCHRNEIIARLKEDFGYETRLPLTGPIHFQFSVFNTYMGLLPKAHACRDRFWSTSCV